MGDGGWGLANDGNTQQVEREGDKTKEILSYKEQWRVQVNGGSAGNTEGTWEAEVDRDK